MSNVYFVDGRQLEPEEFGLPIHLQEFGRPKKYNIRDENNPNDGSTWSNGVTLGAGSFLEPASKVFLTETSSLVLHHMTHQEEEALIHQ